jgi:tetratricopeptide (TPR) repeat protein
VLAGTLLGAAVLAGGLLLRGGEPGAGAEGTAANVVAVFPFTVRGDPTLGYLEDGLSSLLSTGLDGAGSLRSVDPHAVLAMIQRERPGSGDPARAARIAAEMGAGFFVLGDATGGGAELRIDARLYDVGRGGRPVSVASARGDADSVFALVDLVAAQLIAAQRGDSARAVSRLAALTTHSLPALKAYLEGEREFQRGSFPRAIAGYQRAVALDSTFALAYYRLAASFAWSGNDSSLQASEQAVRFGRRLPVADRELLDAQHLFEQGRADEAERAYREILRRRPYEVDALFELGEVLFHFNPGRGRPIAESQAYFDRARRWNHSDAPLIHMLEVLAFTRDYAGYDSLMAGIKPESHFWHTGRMVQAFQLGGEPEQRAVETALASVPERELATVASHALSLVENDAAAARVVRQLLAPGRSPRLRALGHALLAHLHLAGGRWRAAAAQIDTLRGIDPVRAAIHGGLLFSAPHMPIPRAEIESMRDRVAAAPAEGASRLTELTYAGDDSLHAELRTYVLGLLEARLGRHPEALRHAAALERVPARDPGLSGALAAGIRAQIHLAEERPEQALAVLQAPGRPLRVNELMIFSPLGLRHERFLRAEALDRLGRREEALGWLSSFAEHSPAGRLYLAPARFREGEILERLGRHREAAASYGRFAALWREADPELQPLVAEARRRSALLAGE